ncbi:hypothetical protein TWF696_004666 [Orbilia brochopaga]|uniref:Uncharacterized protein n=1 Tax=Orbilia brochopaga TaxID=3140254 RepID=A0AAV9V6X5_9PEZI
MLLYPSILTTGRPESHSAPSQLPLRTLLNVLRLSISTIFVSTFLTCHLAAAAPLSAVSIPTIPKHHHHLHIHRHTYVPANIHHHIDPLSTPVPPIEQRSHTSSEEVWPRDYGYNYAEVPSIGNPTVILVTTTETILRTVAPQTVTPTTYIDRRGEEEEGRPDDVDGPPPDVNIDFPGPGGVITSTITTTTTTTTTTTIYTTVLGNGVPGAPGGPVNVGPVVSGSVPQWSPGPDAGAVQSPAVPTPVAPSPPALESASTRTSSTRGSLSTTSTAVGRQTNIISRHASSHHSSSISSTSKNNKTKTGVTTTHSSSSSKLKPTTSAHRSNSTLSGIFLDATPTAPTVYSTGKNTPIPSLETVYINSTSTVTVITGYLITGAVTPTASPTASEGASSRAGASSMLVQVASVGLFIIGGWFLDAW